MFIEITEIIVFLFLTFYIACDLFHIIHNKSYRPLWIPIIIDSLILLINIGYIFTINIYNGYFMMDSIEHLNLLRGDLLIKVAILMFIRISYVESLRE